MGEILSAAFRMRVLVHDPIMGDEEIARRGGESVELDELLKESDYVTLHTPLTDQTRGMIGEREYRLMKPTAYFVNNARGGLYDEEALELVLKEGVIAGAALDVWAIEPPSFDHPLLKLDNVLATPHSSGQSHEAIFNMSENAGTAVARHLPRRAAVAHRQPGGLAGIRGSAQVHRRGGAGRLAPGRRRNGLRDLLTYMYLSYTISCNN